MTLHINPSSSPCSCPRSNRPTEPSCMICNLINQTMSSERFAGPSIVTWWTQESIKKATSLHFFLYFTSDYCVIYWSGKIWRDDSFAPFPILTATLDRPTVLCFFDAEGETMKGENLCIYTHSKLQQIISRLENYNYCIIYLMLSMPRKWQGS